MRSSARRRRKIVVPWPARDEILFTTLCTTEISEAAATKAEFEGPEDKGRGGVGKGGGEGRGKQRRYSPGKVSSHQARPPTHALPILAYFKLVELGVLCDCFV